MKKSEIIIITAKNDHSNNRYSKVKNPSYRKDRYRSNSTERLQNDMVTTDRFFYTVIDDKSQYQSRSNFYPYYQSRRNQSRSPPPQTIPSVT